MEEEDGLEAWLGECQAQDSRSADGLDGSPRSLCLFRFSRPLTLLEIHRQMSESEQEMVLKLAAIKTLRESYKAGVLKAVKSPKYPPKPCLLDHVSLWLVTPISGRVQNGG